MRIGVFSDFHITPGSSNTTSFLDRSNKERPVEQDHLASLDKFIKERDLRLDVILVPGDYGDLSNKKGFCKALKIIGNIANKTDCEHVFCTVGNHDITIAKDNPLSLFQGLQSKIPNANSNNDSFYKNGFQCYHIPDHSCNVLVINSMFNYQNESDLKHGNLSNTQLGLLKSSLDNLTKSDINICLLHHPPYPHEYYSSNSNDFLNNGTILVEILEEHRFQLIVHGHKHESRIKFTASPICQGVIFSAASFSIIPAKEGIPGSYNAFHIIDIEKTSDPECDFHGSIESLQFVLTKGWLPLLSRDLLPKEYFGCNLPGKFLAVGICDHMRELATVEFQVEKSWNELTRRFPYLKFLPSNQHKLLTSSIDSQSGFKVEYEAVHGTIESIIYTEPE